MKIRTGCQYVGYFYYSEHLNCATQNLRLGRVGCGLDIAELKGYFAHLCFLRTVPDLATQMCEPLCSHVQQAIKNSMNTCYTHQSYPMLHCS